MLKRFANYAESQMDMGWMAHELEKYLQTNVKTSKVIYCDWQTKCNIYGIPEYQIRIDTGGEKECGNTFQVSEYGFIPYFILYDSKKLKKKIINALKELYEESK